MNPAPFSSPHLDQVIVTASSTLTICSALLSTAGHQICATGSVGALAMAGCDYRRFSASPSRPCAAMPDVPDLGGILESLWAGSCSVPPAPYRASGALSCAGLCRGSTGGHHRPVATGNGVTASSSEPDAMIGWASRAYLRHSSLPLLRGVWWLAPRLCRNKVAGVDRQHEHLRRASKFVQQSVPRRQNLAATMFGADAECGGSAGGVHRTSRRRGCRRQRK